MYNIISKLKAEKMFFAIAVLTLLSFSSAYGQTFFGLEAGRWYSPEEVESAVGEKAIDITFSGRSWRSGYNEKFPGGLMIKAYENGEFFCFIVTGKRYRLFEDSLEGGLGVGDDISRIFSLRNAYPKAEMNLEGESDVYRIFTHQEDNYSVQYNRKNGKITMIKWCIAR